MKLNSIYMPALLGTLVVAPALGNNTVDSDPVIVRARVTGLIAQMIKKNSVEEIKTTLDKELAPFETADAQTKQLIITTLSEQAHALRTQKMTQLATDVSKSKVWAGVKAGIFGWIACAKLYQSYVWNDQNCLIRSEGWNNIFSWVVQGKHISTMYGGVQSVFDLALFYFSARWSYENAHFAYYGNSLLIAEIKKLDAIIALVDPSEKTALLSAPGENLYNF